MVRSPLRRPMVGSSVSSTLKQVKWNILSDNCDDQSIVNIYHVALTVVSLSFVDHFGSIREIMHEVCQRSGYGTITKLVQYREPMVHADRPDARDGRPVMSSRVHESGDQER